MGIEYTLVKQDQPEVFELSKGSWDLVFSRKYGTYIPIVGHVGSNFEESFKITNIVRLSKSIEKYMPWWTDADQIDELAGKIQA